MSRLKRSFDRSGSWGAPGSLGAARSARDLEGIIEFVAEDSAAASEQMLDVILRAVRSLGIMSERGRIVPELAEPSIREIFVYSYRLIYRVRKDQVEILTIVHGARDFSRLLRPDGL